MKVSIIKKIVSFFIYYSGELKINNDQSLGAEEAVVLLGKNLREEVGYLFDRLDVNTETKEISLSFSRPLYFVTSLVNVVKEGKLRILQKEGELFLSYTFNISRFWKGTLFFFCVLCFLVLLVMRSQGIPFFYGLVYEGGLIFVVMGMLFFRFMLYATLDSFLKKECTLKQYRFKWRKWLPRW